jgi:hypothetical protein
MQMPYNSLVLSITTFIYGLAGVLYIFAWVFKKPAAGRLATWVTVIAFSVNTFGILLRWVESYQVYSGHGYAPLSNMYESMVFFGWTIGASTSGWNMFTRIARHRRLAAPLACLALAYAALSPDSRFSR